MENRILSLLPDETGKKLIITFGDGSTQSLPLDELARILASIGDLTDLDTTVKSSLVAAVNEVYGKIDADLESAILDFVSDHQADILALLTATDPTLTQANKPADAKATGDEIAGLNEALTSVETTLTHKADATGTSPDLVAGSAEQLLSDVGTEDKAPYLFRAVPYDSTRVGEEVVGCTVGWNQLVGSDTSSVTVTSGHKLYTVIGGTASIVASDGTAISVTGGTDTVVDLTAWFGSTIADYAYTLETATAGSGVAWIKQFLPDGYIPYSAPGLKSVSGLSGHKFVGFNAWDEQWEVGGLSSGDDYAYNDRIRSKNYIPLISGATYYLKCSTTYTGNFWASYYDANKAYIAGGNPAGTATISKNNTFDVPANARFMRFQITSATTYANDICINLSDPAKNGTYEPYKATTYALDSDLTLRGMLKMDASNHVYADGDVYGSDGTVTRRYGVVDLGTLTWTYANDVFKCEQLTGHKITEGVNIICSKYIAIDATYTVQYMTDKTIKTNNSQTSWFYVKDSAYSDAATFKTAMSGVMLVYELATPTTETADPYASPQSCTPGGTEEYVYAEGGSGVVVGHNSKYLKNMRSELERVSVAVPDAPSSDGTYTLKATVSSGTVTYGWVSD